MEGVQRPDPVILLRVNAVAGEREPHQAARALLSSNVFSASAYASCEQLAIVMTVPTSWSRRAPIMKKV